MWSDDEVVVKYKKKKVFVISEGHTYCIESDAQQQQTTVPKLALKYSNPEESDSVVVLYSKYAHELAYENEKCNWKDGKINVNKNVDLCSFPQCQIMKNKTTTIMKIMRLQ